MPFSAYGFLRGGVPNDMPHTHKPNIPDRFARYDPSVQSKSRFKSASESVWQAGSRVNAEPPRRSMRSRCATYEDDVAKSCKLEHDSSTITTRPGACIHYPPPCYFRVCSIKGPKGRSGYHAFWYSVLPCALVQDLISYLYKNLELSQTYIFCLSPAWTAFLQFLRHIHLPLSPRSTSLPTLPAVELKLLMLNRTRPSLSTSTLIY